MKKGYEMEPSWGQGHVLLEKTYQQKIPLFFSGSVGSGHGSGSGSGGFW